MTTQGLFIYLLDAKNAIKVFASLFSKSDRGQGRAALETTTAERSEKRSARDKCST